jgi:hypothetical protein
MYVALHQAFCMWSVNRAEAYECLAVSGLEAKFLDAGFQMIENLLMKNDENEIRPEILEFFTTFPIDLPSARTNCPEYWQAFQDAKEFLRRATTRYLLQLQSAYVRGYPYLVEELLGDMACKSSTLQMVLFRACYRRLLRKYKIPEITARTERLEALFKNDQARHKDARGQFVSMAPIMKLDELAGRHVALIREYRTILERPESEAVGGTGLSMQSTQQTATPASLAPSIGSNQVDPSNHTSRALDLRVGFVF